MPRYLHTKGKTKLAIGICDRCHEKVAYVDLRPDGNSPGLRVCKKAGCWDHYDPWRLPARQPENITLRNPRLDTRIGILTVFLVTENENYLMAENGDFLITTQAEGL
jgi:hypothetical protein